MNEKQEPHCSFCGKTRDLVEMLLAGPNNVAFICNECVTLGAKQMNDPPHPLGAFSHAYHRHDYESAVKALRPLAEDGHAEAQFWLGQMYEFGRGVKQDYTAAFKWYEQSADKRESWGNGCSAQAQMGVMYKWGTGIKQDDKEAYFWLLLAERCGYSNLLDRDGYFTKRLTEKQKADAEERVQEWLRTRPAPVPRKT
jgi:hypothetical protein